MFLKKVWKTVFFFLVSSFSKDKLFLLQKIAIVFIYLFSLVNCKAQSEFSPGKIAREPPAWGILIPFLLICLQQSSAQLRIKGKCKSAAKEFNSRSLGFYKLLCLVGCLVFFSLSGGVHWTLVITWGERETLWWWGIKMRELEALAGKFCLIIN